MKHPYVDGLYHHRSAIHGTQNGIIVPLWDPEHHQWLGKPGPKAINIEAIVDVDLFHCEMLGKWSLVVSFWPNWRKMYEDSAKEARLSLGDPIHPVYCTFFQSMAQRFHDWILIGTFILYQILLISWNIHAKDHYSQYVFIWYCIYLTHWSVVCKMLFHSVGKFISSQLTFTHIFLKGWYTTANQILECKSR